MTRTSHAPATTDSVVGGTTILPGVALPGWLRPDEPIAPEPDHAPQAAPTSVARAGSAVLTVGEPEAPASDSVSADAFLLEAAAAAAAAHAARAAQQADQQADVQAAPPSPYPTAPPTPEPVAAELPVLTPPAPEAV